MIKTVTITVQQDLTPEAVDLETARGGKKSQYHLLETSNETRFSDSTYQFNPPAGDQYYYAVWELIAC